ncbi:hypothetical protein [Kineosporia sp. NBRC 101731]|uniref:hypothetical protein n=1 Tax=Kineosporia sp. NBRC 101731 TaxID=3032199 RepID=UPI0024A36407|nr:hypothetical protein [Kineosporia sp. NBRC 101731]GLY30488.1 hypothetical protein Kisp02_38530 [Kineosporia sp. NBRC 101731]
MRPILYYVHHQGLGHWRRALAVAGMLERPVVLASSGPPPGELPATCRHLRLPLDWSDRDYGDGAGNDAHGQLHWAPLHEDGLLHRHQMLLDAVARYRPLLAVVDVSVEVTVLLRTSGVPVVAVRQPGLRDDPAHALGFALADEVVMPVPQSWGLHTGRPRTRAVGLVSGARRVVAESDDGGRPRAVVLVGSGGSRLGAKACAQIAAGLPGHDVHVLGLSGPTAANLSFRGRIEDVGTELGAAHVAIGNTGLGTLGDVVAARRPFVALPEERPFGEQEATARALEAAGDAVVLTRMPGPTGWAQAVARATTPPALVADGAERFARLLEERCRTVDPVAVTVG